MKKMIHTARTSVTVKSLAFAIFLTVGILICMELVTMSNIKRVEQRAVENYENSIRMYCDYWNSKLEIITRSVIQLTDTRNEDVAYWTVCNSEKKLEVETSKMMLMKSMSEIARIHQNEIMVFCYVPEKNIYVKSTNNLVPMKERLELDQEIKNYTKQNKEYNSKEWAYFTSGKKTFFIKIFSSFNGYIGALVPCETMLEDMVNEQGVICKTELLDSNKKTVFSFENEQSELGDANSIFQVGMECLKYDIQFWMVQKYASADRIYMKTLFLATAAVGILLLIGNIIFQIHYVLGPLNTLKRAMEKFSQGRFDIRLPEEHKSGEIHTLFQTFNDMIIQISSLKIQIYESKLEQERIQSNYLRVQIQPHFYTNILTLIYGLAQMKDYAAIQKLAMTTGKYFRYLLGEKGTFVKLQEEIQGVKNYIEIQQIRYGAYLKFAMDVEEGLEKELILPMIIQTFVGNSIKHNVTLVPVLEVNVAIHKKDGMLQIEVADNGAGFEKEILEKLEQNESLVEDGSHIGICNVKERLKLFYGEKASVKIESRPGCTRAIIVFQELMTKEEQDEYSFGG